VEVSPDILHHQSNPLSCLGKLNGLAFQAALYGR
jgi:hypothetical protein